MPNKFLKKTKQNWWKNTFSDQRSVLCAACVASVGEQPEPGEEKIIRSQRHDHMIAEIFTFATGSRNNGYERQCGIWGKKQNFLCCSNLHWECEKTNMSEKGLWLCKSKKKYIFTFLQQGHR